MICCIFGSADICDYSRINIPKDAVIIAADGGYRHCIKLGITPDCIVGDFDSNMLELPDNCEIIRAPCEKDDTDLILAVKTGYEMHCRTFHIYGADGGRMSHTIAAVQTLAYIERIGCDAMLFGSGCVMRIQSNGKKSYCRDDLKYISLFSLTEHSVLKVSGLKYSGDITLRYDFPLGVSNEFDSSTAEIEVISGKILIITDK